MKKMIALALVLAFSAVAFADESAPAHNDSAPAAEATTKTETKTEHKADKHGAKKSKKHTKKTEEKKTEESAPANTKAE